MSELTHLDEEGRARMVDVAGKEVTAREAVAEACVRLRPETLDLIQSGGMPKGDVLAVARIAGIQAAKRTPELIPLCHGIALSSVEIDLSPVERDGERVLVITATARARDRTGVEMEALTAASVAALTVYDMCKAVDRGMEIAAVKLMAKSGGRSGDWCREETS